MFSSLSRVALRILLLLAATETVLAAFLTATAKVRSRLQEEPREGFPREVQEEIRLESGDERLKLYLDYEGLYEAMLEEIERAESHIFVETFIWKDDEIGCRFVEALARKAREGVEVYAIYDGLANLRTASEFFPEEVHAVRFRPFSGPTSLFNPYNFVRSHRKTFVVDGRVAFLGGWNIADDYRTRWRDTQVRVRGDLVHEIEEAFVSFWNEHRPKDLPEISLPGDGERDWNPATVLRVNDPTLGLFPIRAMFFGPMNRAKRRLYLTSVYFIPSRKLKIALMDAVKRGVDVQVLLPGQSSYVLADWLARSPGRAVRSPTSSSRRRSPPSGRSHDPYAVLRMRGELLGRSLASPVVSSDRINKDLTISLRLANTACGRFQAGVETTLIGG